MKADINFLKDRFEKFNQTIFRNPLPTPMMHITSARSFMGQFKAERQGIAGKREIYHLTLSNRYDLPENDIEDIIIHEMIHFHIHLAGIHDSSSHGRVFRKIMNEINTRFKRNITVSHRCTPEQLDTDRHMEHKIICLCTMTDGRQLVCNVSKSRVFEIYRAFADWDQIAEQQWYWVFGSYFNRYRRVLTPKLYPIDKEGIALVKEGVRLAFTVMPSGRLSLQPQK